MQCFILFIHVNNGSKCFVTYSHEIKHRLIPIIFEILLELASTNSLSSVHCNKFHVFTNKEAIRFRYFLDVHNIQTFHKDRALVFYLDKEEDKIHKNQDLIDIVFLHLLCCIVNVITMIPLIADTEAIVQNVLFIKAFGQLISKLENM